jgi:hypothetical protein
MAKIQIENGKMVLSITYADSKKIAEWKRQYGKNLTETDCLYYTFEQVFCNSEWRLWADGNSAMHKYLGALTDGEIFTFEHQENDDGEITAPGRVFWHEAYAVESIIKVLLWDGRFVLSESVPDTQ